jgi:4-hydroxy-tetrahydrodipicolinate synthase
MVQAMQIVKDKPKDFLVISGDDMIAFQFLAGGAGSYPL